VKNEAREGGFAQAKVVEKRRLLVGIQPHDFRLDACRKHETSGMERLKTCGERVRHRLARRCLAAIQRDEERPVAQEPVTPERSPVELRLRYAAQRLPVLEERLHFLEGGLLLRGCLLPPGTIETTFDRIEIGEHALEVKRLEVAQRIGVALNGGILKITDHETERILLPNLLEHFRRQSFLVGTVLAGDVAEGHLGVGGLLWREDPGQRVDPLVGHANRAVPQLTAEADRHTEPRHGVEDRRLARAGKSYQSDLHP
jgi:hypothetical protein